jgi:hypothetical protein
VLDIGTFVSFLLLFCAAAGITASASDDPTFFEDFADKNRRNREWHSFTGGF